MFDMKIVKDKTKQKMKSWIKQKSCYSLNQVRVSYIKDYNT